MHLTVRSGLHGSLAVSAGGAKMMCMYEQQCLSTLFWLTQHKYPGLRTLSVFITWLSTEITCLHAREDYIKFSLCETEVIYCMAWKTGNVPHSVL